MSYTDRSKCIYIQRERSKTVQFVKLKRNILKKPVYINQQQHPFFIIIIFFSPENISMKLNTPLRVWEGKQVSKTTNALILLVFLFVFGTSNATHCPSVRTYTYRPDKQKIYDSRDKFKLSRFFLKRFQESNDEELTITESDWCLCYVLRSDAIDDNNDRRERSEMKKDNYTRMKMSLTV